MDIFLLFINLLGLFLGLHIKYETVTIQNDHIILFLLVLII
jgi:hypothetical protein